MEGRRRWRLRMQKAPELQAPEQPSPPRWMFREGKQTALHSSPLSSFFFSSQLFRSAQQTLGLDPELSGICCTRSRAAQPSEGSRS